jgi:hypothetical protein
MSDSFAEHETPFPSSLPDNPSYSPLSNELLPLSREDLQIRDFDDGNISDEDGGNESSLLLFSPEATPATLVSHTSSTAAYMNPQILRSRGVGIEEGLRRDDIEHSYWPKLLRMSPKSPSPDLGTSASESEANSQVEEGLVVSTPPRKLSYFLCETGALNPIRKIILYFSWERES